MVYIFSIIIVFIIITLWSKKRDSDRINKIFENRKVLEPVEFYNHYYSDYKIPKFVVIDLLAILEIELDTDVSRLIPEDDFSKNLKYFFEIDSMANVEIIISIEDKFGITISDHEAENIKTINDIVLLVGDKVKAPHKSLQKT